jgi:hypothetical protein
MWTLHDQHASLQHGPLELTLPLDDPARGLTAAQLDDRPLAWPDWLVLDDQRQVPLSLVDRFLRKDELVGCFAEGPDRRIVLEASWRQLPLSADAVGLELLVAAQNESHDEALAIHAVNRLAVDQCLLLDNLSGEFRPAEAGAGACQAILCRWSDSPWSYLELLHPQDQDEAVLDGDESEPGVIGWASRLCHGALEKGVIRRSRLQFWFVQREQDELLAQQLRQQFNSASLPLGR